MAPCACRHGHDYHLGVPASCDFPGCDCGAYDARLGLMTIVVAPGPIDELAKNHLRSCGLRDCGRCSVCDESEHVRRQVARAIRQ